MGKSVLDGTEWTATQFAGVTPEEQRATAKNWHACPVTDTLCSDRD